MVQGTFTSLWRRIAAVATAVVVGATLVVAPAVMPGGGSDSASAADLSKFRPGNIISDEVFFNSGTMSEAQIQSFLNSKVSRCDTGKTCLKDFTQSTYDRAADAMCRGYAGAANESAARIIKKVADSCGINPQVIIVMLQKEQALVADSAPGSWAWTASMGYACPDTAACDSKYFGFYNQVYMGSWQLKRYGNPPGTSNYFTWFPIGKSAPIRYSPTASCGSSNVVVENKATAALYYYTPYQPNASALAAGYGASPDKTCSAYGNRNFYNYFTDWFGSTQGQMPSLVQGQTQGDVFLVVGSTKHHIADYGDYLEYRGALGDRKIVADSVVNALTPGPVATALVRNPATGEVLLLQSGKLHHFGSCELVAMWGYYCGQNIDLSLGQIQSLTRGPAMTEFAKRPGSDTLYKISGSSLMTMDSPDAARAFNGGTSPFAAVLRDSVAARYTQTRPLLGPSTLVKDAGSVVYFVDGTTVKHRLPHWEFATEFGLPATYSSTSTTTLNAYQTGEELSLFVKCGTALYLVNGGKKTQVVNGDAAGFPTTTLTDTSCQALPTSGSVAGPVFVRSGSSPDVYLMTGGKLRWVTTVDALMAANNGAWPTVLSLTAGAFSKFSVTTPFLPVGSFVQAAGDSVVYLIDGPDKRYRLPSWEVAGEFGFAQKLIDVKTSDLAGYAKGDDLSMFAKCNGELYFANGGKLTKVVNGDAGGFPVTTLDPSTCQRLSLSGAVKGPVFVQGAGTGDVFLLTEGTRRHVASAEALTALNGGSWPTVLTIQKKTLASFTEAAPVVTPASFVQASGDNVVYFINGLKQKVRLPHWSFASEFGLPERYSAVTTAQMSGYPRSSTDLSLFVRCGGKLYFAAGGALSLVASGDSSGFAVTDVDATACSRLNLAGTQVGSGKVYVKSANNAAVYVTEGGKLRLLGAGERAGTVLTVDQRTVQALS
ncbi:hypothetical protein [Mycetocola zhujimingii]|uniref:hypothetical protein n=1 Tax=Mycetocola zhujimingii TaxID=2079792 RepID=UPI0011B21082|nr:hypothetical protein [Mycetocola zhujimingii]